MGHFQVAVSLSFEVSLDQYSTIVREMSLICITIRNSFPFEWLCTRTRFETEAYSNSEMGYDHAPPKRSIKNSLMYSC